MKEMKSFSKGSNIHRVTKVVGWVELLLGVLLIVFNLHHNIPADDNMGMMIGIGFILAGMFTFGAGTFLYLLVDSESKKASS